MSAHILANACPDCGADMVLKASRFGLFYGCVTYPACRSTHGAHPDGSPFGIPANAATKRARIAAHAAFDQLWQFGAMKRKAAYRWLQIAMGLSHVEAHIGRFTMEQCEKLVQLLAERPVLPRRYDAWESVATEVPA